LTGLHSLPGLQRAMAMLAVNVVATCTLGPRRRTQLVCVLMQAIPANDVWVAITLGPSVLIGRINTLHSSAHWLVFPGVACGAWLASRSAEELSFRAKLLALCCFEAMHYCSHSIRFARTGSEKLLLVPTMYFHIPAVAAFLIVLRLVGEGQARGWGVHRQPAQKGPRSGNREQTPEEERDSAACQPPRAYQKLSRLIDEDAVWEALEDAVVECDTTTSNATPCRPHSFTTGAVVLVDTNLAAVTVSGGHDVVHFEFPTASGFGLPLLERSEGTMFAVPPLTTVALGSITSPGEWDVDGHVMHGTLYTVTLIADV